MTLAFSFVSLPNVGLLSRLYKCCTSMKTPLFSSSWLYLDCLQVILPSCLPPAGDDGVEMETGSFSMFSAAQLKKAGKTWSFCSCTAGFFHRGCDIKSKERDGMPWWICHPRAGSPCWFLPGSHTVVPNPS